MEALGIAAQGEIGSGAAIFHETVVGTATRLAVEREGITGQMPGQVEAAALLAWAQGEVVALAAEADPEVVAGVAEPYWRLIIRIWVEVLNGSQIYSFKVS